MAFNPNQSTEKKEEILRVGSAWARTFSYGRILETGLPGGNLPGDLVNRSFMDAVAAWQRWHEPLLAERLSPVERRFFALFDRVRVERCAALSLPGMASNLAATAHLAPADPLLRQLYQCSRLLADGATAEAQVVVEDWSNQHESFPGSRVLGRWSRTLGLRMPWLRTVSIERQEALTSVLRELLVLDAWTEDVLFNAQKFARRIAPVVKLCGQTLDDLSGVPKQHDPFAPRESQPEPTNDEMQEDPWSENEIEGPGEPEAPITRSYPGYSVFTQALDETYPASRWFDQSDMSRLDQFKTVDRRRAKRLARQLHRRIQAARLCSWDFDQEEGQLDSRRLARLIQPGSDTRVFRREAESEQPEAAVSLLVDLSGSMRGERILLAALSLDLAVHVLESCGIQCEVLGYTTRFGAENVIVKRWRQKGSHTPAGRLNAIRHVIFKSFDESWRRCRKFLALMLREDFGSENLDGEALDWAARRLSFVPARNRVLIVLSDGSPYDQATVSHNGIQFLEGHLREVIDRISRSGIQVSAIGAGMDVARFYSRSIVLGRGDDVSSVLFEELADLVVPDNL